MERTAGQALVLGLGASGHAAARLLAGRGMRVTVLDSGDGPALQERATSLRPFGIETLLGQGSLPAGAFDLCVTSPGIALDSDWLQALRASGIPVISELELGARHCPAPMLAVTGTNGKSTFVKLCVDALTAAGRRACAAGNYGLPLCEVALAGRPLDWVVVEVSSFQLETVSDFHPRIGVLLNVQPNHLDRHGTLESYRATKARLFARMGSGDTALVYDAGRDEIRALAGGGAARATWLTFGLSKSADYHYYSHQVLFRSGEGVGALALGGTRFDNEILGIAAAGATGALLHCGVALERIERTMREFVPLPHRMSVVAERGGVLYINDSKATTLAAMQAGLRMTDRPVRLIAGGRLKEYDLAVARDALGRRAIAVYLIGEASARMAEAWKRTVPCLECGTLEQAVRRASQDARAGEMILLSPGCASFDQFNNFEDRGNQFTTMVRSLQ